MPGERAGVVPDREGMCKGLKQELPGKIEGAARGQVFLLLTLQVCLGIDFIPSALRSY